MTDLARLTRLGTAAGLCVDAYEAAVPVVHADREADYVAFAGTRGADDWRRYNCDVRLSRAARGHAGSGFIDAACAASEWVDLPRPTTDRPLVLCGHSLGGAIAAITAAGIAHEYPAGLHLITFGAPRVGDRTFCQYLAVACASATRVIHDCDAVPHLLPSRFHHAGSRLWLDRNGKRIGPGRGFLRRLRWWLGRVSLDDRTDHGVARYALAAALYVAQERARPRGFQC